MVKQRNYKKEYQDFHSKPQQKKNRAKRNTARARAGLKKGSGMEVDHIRPLSKGGSNGPRNTRVVKRSTNRRKGNK